MTNNPHSDETRLKQADIKYIHSLMSNNAYGTEELRIIRVLIDAWNRRPTPPAQPSGLSLEEREAIEMRWAYQVNSLINELTPDIKEKAFNPGWFQVWEKLIEASKAICQLTATQAERELLRAKNVQLEQIRVGTENAVKFADKRFAERGIELTALQHDIAKANRQLTAAQADLLNVRAELERVKTLTLVGLMDRIAKADAELAKACIQNGMLRDKNLSVLDFDNEMARTKLSLSTARTRIAELEEMHRGAVARCREQEIAKDGNQKLVTGTEFGEMFKQVKAERDSLYANTKLIEANAVKIDAKCSHWEKQCTDARSSRDAIKAELEKCREALKAAYVENQNLHCVMRGNQKSFAALERQTTILRAALTPPKEGGQS